MELLRKKQETGFTVMLRGSELPEYKAELDPYCPRAQVRKYNQDKKLDACARPSLPVLVRCASARMLSCRRGSRGGILGWRSSTKNRGLACGRRNGLRPLVWMSTSSHYLRRPYPVL